MENKYKLSKRGKIILITLAVSPIFIYFLTVGIAKAYNDLILTSLENGLASSVTASTQAHQNAINSDKACLSAYQSLVEYKRQKGLVIQGNSPCPFNLGNSDKPETEETVQIKAKPENRVMYQKKEVGEDQNKIVRYAAFISDNNLDFLATMERENGLWDMYRKHPNLNSDGTRDWACGLNSAYHKDIIEKIKAKSVTPEQIMDYCYKVYTGRPTAFYGYRIRNQAKSKFYLAS